jgi:hypothetical protein
MNNTEKSEYKHKQGASNSLHFKSYGAGKANSLEGRSSIGCFTKLALNPYSSCALTDSDLKEVKT